MTNLEFSSTTQELRGVDRAGTEEVKQGVGRRMRGRTMVEMSIK